MKVLPQGTLRYLLLNTAEILRNRQRGYASAPVAIVAEPDPSKPGTFIYTEGYGVLVDGAAALVYDATKKVVMWPDRYNGRRIEENAAYATYSRIAVAELADEVESVSLMLVVPPEAAADDKPADKPAARPSTKQPSVKKPEEGQK